MGKIKIFWGWNVLKKEEDVSSPLPPRRIQGGGCGSPFAPPWDFEGKNVPNLINCMCSVSLFKLFHYSMEFRRYLLNNWIIRTTKNCFSSLLKINITNDISTTILCFFFCVNTPLRGTLHILNFNSKSTSKCEQ